MIPLLLAGLLTLVSPHHNTFEEWDGVFHVFAAREILAGQGYQGWASHFWPPLYPLLIAAGDLALSEHAAAKLISAVAAVLLLVAAFWLAWELFRDRRVALLTQVFLLVNPLFVRSAIQAENHMLDSLFFVGGLLLVSRALHGQRLGPMLWAGGVSGLAGLTRYTSLVLILAPCLFVFLIPRERRWRLAAAFILSFSAVSLPWWLYNWYTHGSPLHTWHYLNIGGRVVSKNEGEWLWRLQDGFTGLSGIVLSYPQAFLRNFLRNVFDGVELTILQCWTLAPFVVPGLAEGLLSERARVWKSTILFLGVYVLFLGLVSQAFVFEQVFLSWIVIGSVGAVALLVRYADRLTERAPVVARWRMPALALMLLVVLGARSTAASVSRYTRQARDDGGYLSDVRPATDALRAFDPEIKNKYVMSRHPAWAYYAGSRYLQLPGYYAGPVDGLVSYRGLSEKIKSYAPRYPALTPNSAMSADYLVYDSGARHDLPQFLALTDPGSAEVPRTFRLVYRSESTVVYAIRPRSPP